MKNRIKIGLILIVSGILLGLLCWRLTQIVDWTVYGQAQSTYLGLMAWSAGAAAWVLFAGGMIWVFKGYLWFAHGFSEEIIGTVESMKLHEGDDPTDTETGLWIVLSQIEAGGELIDPNDLNGYKRFFGYAMALSRTRGNYISYNGTVFSNPVNCIEATHGEN